MVECRTGRNIIRVGAIGGIGAFLSVLYADHIPAGLDFDGKLDFAGVFGADPHPDGTLPYPEVIERIDKLEIPASLNTGEVVNLSTTELRSITDEIARHKLWIEDVIAEYEQVMMTDTDSAQKLAELKAAYAELLEVEERIKGIKEAMYEHAEVMRDMIERGVDPAVVDAFEKAFITSDKMPELYNVREDFEALYTAAHQISLLDEGGKVWVGGAPRDLDDVYQIDFTSIDERNVPRRSAFALNQFFSDNIGKGIIVTEGHTGDPERSSSYANEMRGRGDLRSSAHRTGVAFDVDFLHPETPEDVYKVLQQTDPSYKVEYHVKSHFDYNRMIYGVMHCAMEDGMSEDEAKAYAQSFVKRYDWVTGGHFHVVATGGIGPTINPDGPAPFAKTAYSK